MDYIVFDLEWNQCPYGKCRENKQLPFEIIEIGAVKLNEKKEIVDEFQCLVRPSVYKTLHYRTQEIIQISEKKLKEGKSFPSAIKEFLSWCGDDIKFCTWGTCDLTELQRNMKFYHLLNKLPGPIYYYDVQKLFSWNYDDGKSRKGLENAVKELHLPENDQYHRALGDAYYTAYVFQALNNDKVFLRYSIDSYQNPKSKQEEIEVSFENYSKYISREFFTKEEAMKDKDVLRTKCIYCNKAMRRKIQWFTSNSKNYYCLAYCSAHGYFKGKIRMKKTDQEKYYVIKTVKAVELEEAEDIILRKKQLKSKKRLKRKKEMENQ